MADRMVVGVFNDDESCANAVKNLQKEGFDSQQMSIIMADKQRAQEMSRTTGVGSSAGKGAGVGAVAGGLAGLAIGLSAVAIPGIGPILVGGPIAAGLGLAGTAAATATGAVTGAVSGGIIGALAGLGVPDDRAKVYEHRIKEGGILVAVPTVSKKEAVAEKIMRDHGAEQVSSLAAKEGAISDKHTAET